MKRNDSPPAYRTGPQTANERAALEILANLQAALRSTEYEVLATGGFHGPIFSSQLKLSARLDSLRLSLECAFAAFEATPCSRF